MSKEIRIVDGVECSMEDVFGQELWLPTAMPAWERDAQVDLLVDSMDEENGIPF